MKIFFASSEASPFFSSGELGDMSGSLPPELRRQRTEVRVILPLYAKMASEWRRDLKYVTNFTVPMGWSSKYCGLYSLELHGVVYYFIDNEYYFKRSALYGFYDDGERFAFFSRAILEALAVLDYRPDIIHCNEWQTALVPVYLELYYKGREKFAGLKTVFTIHNIRYQGQYGPEILESTLGIRRESFHIVEYDGVVNFLKGAVESSTLVNTVSPTYAKEIQDSWYAHGLHNFMRERGHKIRGILNGIDINKHNPALNFKIAAQYDESDFTEGKAACKRELRNIFGLDNAAVPLIGMVTRFNDQKGLDLLLYAADEIIDGGMQLVAAGSSREADMKYERRVAEFAARRKGQVAFIFGFSEAIADKVYAGGDMFLIPSKIEPCGAGQMIALRYGAVPIARRTGGLRDTVAEGPSGNGFTFDNYNAKDMRDACFRAGELYRDPVGWEAIVRRAMGCDNNWGTSARNYISMYGDALKPSQRESS
jgi:starch synthase